MGLSRHSFAEEKFHVVSSSLGRLCAENTNSLGFHNSKTKSDKYLKEWFPRINYLQRTLGG